MKATKTLDAINAALESAQESENRTHLGASVLGKKCAREIWYGFRWYGKELFSGRMLRLFDRGQLEESRFISYLEMIGCKVKPVNPSTGKQWQIKFAHDHGGGSCDGVVTGIPDLPQGTGAVIECKTHGEKSFKSLTSEGLCQSKPEHFAQTQIYTVKLGKPAALYMGVCKNTDDLHLELIQPNPPFVATLMSKAEMIVEADTPPPRINKSPGFYICRFCYFKDICHGDVKPLVNCRTCRFSKPIQGGQWICRKFNYILNKQEQATGCKGHRFISNDPLSSTVTLD